MLTAALILSVAGAAAPASAIVCPAELPASAVTVTQPPPGWTGFVPTKLMLNAVGVSTGPLADRATLIGDYRKLKHGVFTVSYDLQGLEKYERWIMCQYGDSNDIVIAKQLTERVKECVVTYTPDRWGNKAIAIACK